MRVSVWDAALTTVAQARAMRGREVLVLSARVNRLLESGASAVVYDTLADPDVTKPGAAGHAGIEGLKRPPEEPRLVWRQRLQALADCFTILPDS